MYTKCYIMHVEVIQLFFYRFYNSLLRILEINIFFCMSRYRMRATYIAIPTIKRKLKINKANITTLTIVLYLYHSSFSNPLQLDASLYSSLIFNSPCVTFSFSTFFSTSENKENNKHELLFFVKIILKYLIYF